MAVIRDKERIEEAMADVKSNPTICHWVDRIRISYAKQLDKYCAEFNCDLTIIFDYVEYSSNSIYFYRGDDKIPIAHVTHTGLRL